jgi:hypothetical protein
MTDESGPDHFLLADEPDPFRRLADGGPRYRETPFDPLDLPPGTIAEPFNAVTASLFIFIVLFWAWRLRGRYRQFPFVSAMLPILLAGGIGGTLYHATRSRYAWFLLDVIPIQILGFAAAVYLALRLSRDKGAKRLLLTTGGLVLASLVLGATLFVKPPSGNPNLRVNLSYLTLAVIVVAPLGAFLVRTRFRHAGWVGAGLAAFAIAWFCRLIDNTGMSDLPMGTHWLWHTFGAICTAFLFEYFARIEAEQQ